MIKGRALVTGAGGFIGGHLAKRLQNEDYYVIGVDVKPRSEWFQTEGCDRLIDGTRVRELSPWTLNGVDEVYHLAADMGGIGFTATQDAACSLNILDTIWLAIHLAPHQSIFYASTACVYRVDLQEDAHGRRLKESDVGPPYYPDHLYGHEKLYGELVLTAHAAERGFRLRTARYHNVYGPHGDWDNGREKAPAAICRKIAEAVVTGNHEIEVWGDGEQSRSFMYIEDCIEGTRRIMNSDIEEPINLGASQWVTINELVKLVSRAAKIPVHMNHDLTKPQGVRGRSSDNSMIRERLGWEPLIPLYTGIAETYPHILDKVERRNRDLHIMKAGAEIHDLDLSQFKMPEPRLEDS